ncbi:MAG: YkgJ family cysteine cluster protein [Candidatus Hodarchaeales archaeon]|jgi:Fe-S-cluster containining protein
MVCNRCAACCKRLQLSAALNPQMNELIRAHYGREIKPGVVWKVAITISHRCKQLTDGNMCRIYAKRPQLCREFDCGGEIGEKLILSVEDK